jgi:gluconate 2-dehydrogenase gamma chain
MADASSDPANDQGVVSGEPRRTGDAPGTSPTTRGTSRRTLLKVLGSGAVGAAVGATTTFVAGGALRSGTPKATIAPPPLRFFNDAQARWVTAMAERIFPRDAAGPGATDARVVTYIDGRLANAWGLGAKTYRQGPFFVPEDSGHGAQTPMTPRDIYKAALEALDAYCNRQFGKSFDTLQVSQQDDVLHALEQGKVDTFTTVPAALFFAIFRQNVVEGLFADPLYGGNANLIGWKWIGFPGDPMAYGDPYGQLIDKFDQPYNVEPKPLQ